MQAIRKLVVIGSGLDHKAAHDGRFEEAVAVARKVLKLAEADQQRDLVKQSRQQLDNDERRQTSGEGAEDR